MKGKKKENVAEGMRYPSKRGQVSFLILRGRSGKKIPKRTGGGKESFGWVPNGTISWAGTGIGQKV